MEDQLAEAVAERVGDIEERFVQKMREQEQRTKEGVQEMVKVRRGGGTWGAQRPMDIRGTAVSSRHSLDGAQHLCSCV